jgi:hypothetical protein
MQSSEYRIQSRIRRAEGWSAGLKAYPKRKSRFQAGIAPETGFVAIEENY